MTALADALRAEIRRSGPLPLARFMARELGMQPVLHLYEPMLPLAFEQEYPGLVGVHKRPTQEGTVDVHTRLDPDNPWVHLTLASIRRSTSRFWSRLCHCTASARESGNQSTRAR